MANNHPQREYLAVIRQSFFEEGILDRNFVNLEKLTDHQTPNFVMDTFDLYFLETPPILQKIAHAIQTSEYDYHDVDKCIDRLISSTSSVGASGILREVNKLKIFWKDQDLGGAREVLPLMLREYDELNVRLEVYFELVRESEPMPESPGEDETNSYGPPPASPDSSAN